VLPEQLVLKVFLVLLHLWEVQELLDHKALMALPELLVLKAQLVQVQPALLVLSVLLAKEVPLVLKVFRELLRLWDQLELPDLKVFQDKVALVQRVLQVVKEQQARKVYPVLLHLWEALVQQVQLDLQEQLVLVQRVQLEKLDNHLLLML
jgi:hypothetical protein